MRQPLGKDYFFTIWAKTRAYNMPMRRLILIATLSLLVLPAWAQRGARGGGMGARGGFAHGPMVGHPGGRFGQGSFSGFGFGFGNPGFGFRNGFDGRFGRQFGNRFHHHNRFFPGFWGGWGWGYATYYPWLDDYSFDQQYYLSDVASSYQSAMYNQQATIEQRLDRIEDRVDALLDRLQSRPPQAPPQVPPQSQSKPEPSSAATFVFRDGHSEQVQNYAIVGQTLWIFTEDHARKVPLAQINPEATDKANEQRGIDLHLPKS
jgi:hypothetical protein